MAQLPRPVMIALEKMKKTEHAYMEIKVINGRYYLHRSTSIWDKNEKKTKKVTEYLGAITLGGVFIPKKSRQRLYETSREIFEYGNCALAYNFIQDSEKILKTLTVDYREVIAASIVKVIDPKPLRLLASRWEKFYLSKKMNAHLSPKKISAVLSELGRSVTPWRELFFNLTKDDDLILYDLTAVFTHSEKLILAEKSYNAHYSPLNQMGVAMAFSTRDTLPVGLELYCGSIKDISTIYEFRAKYPISNIGFIFDRGFSSYKLLVELKEDEIHYIVPLRKDSKYIDLRWMRWKKPFEYRKRWIRWGRKTCDLGYLYFFEDPQIKADEEIGLLKKVEKNELSMSEYEESRKTAGVISIITDLDRDGMEIYDQYKGREDVELAFDTMKNHLDSDKTYLQSMETVRGYFLITFLSLRIYFKVLRRLREKKLTHKISVEEVFLELSKVFMLIETGGKEYYSRIPKRARKMIELFPEMQPMG